MAGDLCSILSLMLNLNSPGGGGFLKLLLAEGSIYSVGILCRVLLYCGEYRSPLAFDWPRDGQAQD